MWLVALLIPGTRNVRFLACLAAASALLLASHLLPNTVGVIVRLGAVALAFIAFLVAHRLGLGSMTSAEETADRLLEQARKRVASDEPQDLLGAIAMLDPVIARPGRLDDRWRAEFRIQRRAWLMRLDISPFPPSGRTPAESFRIVAVRWLTDLRLRRTIWFRSRMEHSKRRWRFVRLRGHPDRVARGTVRARARGAGPSDRREPTRDRWARPPGHPRPRRPHGPAPVGQPPRVGAGVTHHGADGGRCDSIRASFERGQRGVATRPDARVSLTRGLSSPRRQRRPHVSITPPRR